MAKINHVSMPIGIPTTLQLTLPSSSYTSVLPIICCVIFICHPVYSVGNANLLCAVSAPAVRVIIWQVLGLPHAARGFHAGAAEFGEANQHGESEIIAGR